MASHSDIAHAWAHDRGPKTGSRMFREDNRIYSHDWHWILGVNVGNAYYFLAEKYGSNSTSKHEGHVRTAIPHSGHKIGGVPQGLLKDISLHFRSEYDQSDYIHSKLRNMAKDAIHEAIKLMQSKPHIESYRDYLHLPSEVMDTISHPLRIDGHIRMAANDQERPYERIRGELKEYYREFLEDYIANNKDKFLPYGLYLLLSDLKRDNLSSVWAGRYPGYDDRLAHLREVSETRSEAAGGRGFDHSWRGPRTEEDWQEWYAYKNNFKGNDSDGNDSDGFARLRLFKPDKTRVESSLGVIFLLSAMRVALIAYDKRADQLPDVPSSTGKFEVSEVYRNGTEENSYVIYGCHKVRISEARKLVETSKLSE